ncbi:MULTISPECIES: hypothetical protein [Paenibacillus]|uniref:hypothetical protein n=1 Tax=Paenibacillus TaxID=44249 RepID=UPI001123BF2F|nr:MULTISPECIES: hypothetical protein [Paenibacillus]
MGAYRFDWNERLRIRIPVLEMEWEQYKAVDQLAIIEQWELIRGTIPDRVMEFERDIHVKQAQLFEEDSFEQSCILNYEIADYASRINDLHIWYRIDQQLESRRHS